MTDHFHEEIVVRRKRGLYNLLYFVLALTAIVLALLAATSLMYIMNTFDFNLVNIIQLLISGGLAVLLWINKDKMRLEYEYSFTNGLVEIAQVMNNSRRKELVSFKMREVESFGTGDDPRLQDYLARKDAKRIIAVLNRHAPLCYVFTKKNERNYLVVMEPKPELAQLMQTYYERGRR